MSFASLSVVLMYLFSSPSVSAYNPLYRARYGLESRAASSSFCCSALGTALPGKVDTIGDISYINQQTGLDGYWSAQESAVLPTCRVSPTGAHDVSTAVVILAQQNCSFAIRGGGHMAWAGAANIANGVTIDMSAINEVTVSADHQTTSIGAGARWLNVYAKLDVMGLAVSGGRVADVGIGGFMTGGGNTFFAPRFGFACDNVRNYQVVLASGKVVDANADSNPDLFWALKGGNNNFGIVTRFDVVTFAQGLLWGGTIFYPATTAPQQLQHFGEFVTASGNGQDDFASLINIHQYSGGFPALVINILSYSNAQAFPPIFTNFTSLQPQIANTLRFTSLTGLTTEIAIQSGQGQRTLTASLSFTNNVTLLSQLHDIATHYFGTLMPVVGFEGSWVLQPMPRSITAKSAAHGGNALGLDGSEDLVWLDLQISWLSPSDDAKVTTAVESLLRASAAQAKRVGGFREFIYLNYALPNQDPIASYGAANAQRLKSIAAVYDPSQVFQRLVPGGFKLVRTDATCC